MTTRRATRSAGRTTPVSFKQVRIEGGFWGPRMDVNRLATLPIEYRQCKESGRLDAFALTWKPGQPNPPHLFWDSDVAKWIEAVAYSLALHPDPELKQLVDGVIRQICAAQQPDGYLNVHFTVVEPDQRFTNLRDHHELYCAGHLIEAAVAYFDATGERAFLDAMCRYADHIGTVFGTHEGQKRGYDGHEEIELALVRLSRATGEKRYLDLAAYFIDERGRQPFFFDLEAQARGERHRHPLYASSYAHSQAHQPVREQSEVVGHAVRAMYLYCGMADVGAAIGDPTLIRACRRIWDNLVGKRMHITGGIGATHANEGFTSDYDLPNEGAYLETCATIGLLLWAWRMVCADLNGEYADVMERALYNGILSGVSQDGTTFFYGNPLAAHPGFNGNGQFVHKGYHYRRQAWFGCSCCPPNIARLIAQLPGLLYSVGARRLAVHLYARSRGEVTVAGQTVRIVQETDYPWEEQVEIRIEPERAAVWTLALRVPGWCRAAQVRVNGQAPALAGAIRKGYVHITRRWQPGDRVTLRLPMPVECLEAHPAVRQDAGRVALQRGPIVYCLEETDHGSDLNDLLLARDTEWVIRKPSTGFFKGVPLIESPAFRRDRADWHGQLYRSTESRYQATRLTAIPYFMWANRAPGEMLVWIRQATPPLPRTRKAAPPARRNPKGHPKRRA